MIKTKISNKFRIRNAADLLYMPVIINVSKFEEISLKEFSDSFQKAIELRQEIIPIKISSFGGSIHTLLGMIDIIKASPVPVATIALAKAMSSGAFLLSCGTEGHRYAAPSSAIMVHDASSGTFGKHLDMKVSVDEVGRLNKFLYEMMDKNCGQPNGYFDKLVHKKSRTDLFMTAEEAMKHNLVNHIRIPEFNIKASIKVTFG